MSYKDELDIFYGLFKQHLNGTQKATLRWVTCKDIDWDKGIMTATDEDGREYFRVMLGTSSLILKPKIDTDCLIGIVHGHEEMTFLITASEVDLIVSQNAIPSRKHLGGTMPYVFSEYGVLQLANVLNSKMAVQMSIKIIEIFVRLKQALTDTLSLKLEIETIKKKLQNQDKNIELVFSYLEELITKQENNPPRKPIGYKIIGKQTLS